MHKTLIRKRKVNIVSEMLGCLQSAGERNVRLSEQK